MEDIAALETQQCAALSRMDKAEPPPWGEAVECFNELKCAKTDAAKAEALAKLETIIRSGAGAVADRDRLWREFNDLAERKANLVTKERDWLAKLRSCYTAEQGLALVNAVLFAVKKHFGDQREKCADCLGEVGRMLEEP
jgi:hypothetical protein